ncbi:hypothetical protein A3Q56_07244 [Intoshia linei]|uniref:Uncharacterized protein n=1 Tax=Intoshia linei TaxID=1819745 RepID=A0A177AST7_9BILA|nr:hypothetical protein A3Q56_07244 [Intoshia linei]
MLNFLIFSLVVSRICAGQEKFLIDKFFNIVNGYSIQDKNCPVNIIESHQNETITTKIYKNNWIIYRFMYPINPMRLFVNLNIPDYDQSKIGADRIGNHSEVLIILRNEWSVESWSLPINIYNR